MMNAGLISKRLVMIIESIGVARRGGCGLPFWIVTASMFIACIVQQVHAAENGYIGIAYYTGTGKSSQIETDNDNFGQNFDVEFSGFPIKLGVERSLIRAEVSFVDFDLDVELPSDKVRSKHQGIDIDLLLMGETYPVRPFVLIGYGWYLFDQFSINETNEIRSKLTRGTAINLGIGATVVVARHLEVEAGYRFKYLSTDDDRSGLVDEDNTRTRLGGPYLGMNLLF